MTKNISKNNIHIKSNNSTNNSNNNPLFIFYLSYLLLSPIINIIYSSLSLANSRIDGLQIYLGGGKIDIGNIYRATDGISETGNNSPFTGNYLGGIADWQEMVGMGYAYNDFLFYGNVGMKISKKPKGFDLETDYLGSYGDHNDFYVSLILLNNMGLS